MATYYVSLTGNDGNTGLNDTTQAWRHISTAVSRLSPGDTLNILPGTWTNVLDIIRTVSYTVPNGTSTGWGWGLSNAGAITIQGASDLSTIIMPPDGYAAISLDNNSASYLIFKDLTLDGSLQSQPPLDGGGFLTADPNLIYCSNRVHHIRFQGLDVGPSMGSTIALYDKNYDTGNYEVYDHYIEVRQCVVHGAGQAMGVAPGHSTPSGQNTGYGIYATTVKSIISDCKFYDNNAFAVNVYGDDNTIENVWCDNNGLRGAGTGIDIGSSSWGDTHGSPRQYSDNNTIKNCLVTRQHGGPGIVIYTETVNTGVYNTAVVGGSDVGILLQYYNSVTVRNCIVVGNANPQIWDFSASGAVVDHNITSGSIYSIFNDPDNDDYTLKTLSPAIDAGTTVPVTLDKLGVERPFGATWDCGPFEYTGLVSPWQYVNSAGAQSTGGAANVTTPNVTSLTGNLALIAVASLSAYPAPTVTDNRGNEAPTLMRSVEYVDGRIDFYYQRLTVTNANHTWTLNNGGVSQGTAIQVTIFANADSSPFQAVSAGGIGGSAAGTTYAIDVGNVTPSASNQLLAIAFMTETSSAQPIASSSGYSFDQQVVAGYAALGVGIGWRTISAPTGAETPTVDLSDYAFAAAGSVAAFFSGTSSSTAIVIKPNAAQLIATGQTPSITSRFLQPPAGALATTGYPPALVFGTATDSTPTLLLEINRGGGWEDITSDVVIDQQPFSARGMDTNAPTSLLANSGELQATLRNDSMNGKVANRYTFGHANVLSGWTIGTLIRRKLLHNGNATIIWTGKLADCDADTAPRGKQQAQIIAYDYAKDLFETNIRQVPIQIDKTAPEIFAAIFEAMPLSAQPNGFSYDTGLDRYPYALDRLGDRTTRAAGPCADILRSSYDQAFYTAQGYFKHLNRETWLLAPPVATLSESDYTYSNGFDSTGRRDDVWNSVEGTYHPKDPQGPVVLWSQSSFRPQRIEAGDTLRVSTNFRDADETLRLVGAYDIISPVGFTDWVANSEEDGSGLDLTAYIEISYDPWATSVDWRLKNNSVLPAYLTTWQIRGTAVFDKGDPKVSATIPQIYGQRTMGLDFPYQHSGITSQGIVDLVCSEQSELTQRPNEIQFWANTATRIGYARNFEIGQKIVLQKSGFADRTVRIHRIEHEDVEGNVRVKVGIANISSDITVAPPAPVGLTIDIPNDVHVQLSWTNTDPLTSATEVYRDDVLVATVPKGISTYRDQGLTTATDYTYKLKHLKFNLIRSVFSTSVVGRPRGFVTGGTVTTPGDGYEYHTFDSSDDITIESESLHLDILLDGGGAGGATSQSSLIGGGAGGAGEARTWLANVEPAGTYAVVIGAPGAGAASAVAFGGAGGDTTYRTLAALGGGPGGGYLTGNPTSGAAGGCGGGGSGDGGNGGAGNLGYNGGAGDNTGSGTRPGGGGGGMGSAGGAGINNSSTGGTPGSGVTIWGTLYSPGGTGGSTSSNGGNATDYGGGGNGAINGTTAGNGRQGRAVFRFRI